MASCEKGLLPTNKKHFSSAINVFSSYIRHIKQRLISEDHIQSVTVKYIQDISVFQLTCADLLKRRRAKRLLFSETQPLTLIATRQRCGLLCFGGNFKGAKEA